MKAVRPHGVEGLRGGGISVSRSPGAETLPRVGDDRRLPASQIRRGARFVVKAMVLCGW